MAIERTQPIPIVRWPIDEACMADFRRHAPAALARRNSAFMLEAWQHSAEFLLIGAVGLFGLLALGWSAEAALAGLLVGIWVGIIGDALMYVFCRSAIVRDPPEAQHDREVWLVTGALMKGKDHVKVNPSTMVGYDPKMGLIFDLGLGAVMTLFLLHISGMFSLAVWTGLLADDEWRWAMLVLAGWQAITVAYTAIHHFVRGAQAGPVEIHPGTRGLGLFVVVWVIAILGLGDSPLVIVTVINGALVLLGGGAVLAVWMIQQETRWLRDWLRSRKETTLGP
jgi:hypothetical protein